jgi:prepilin-type N-terminal cleavage/methylation domain-containing protein
VIYCRSRNIFRMRRRNGFTLIEIVIAIVILLSILVLAVPSLTGVMADRRLRRSLDGLNSMVRQAQERSISEGRSYLIIWRDKKFALRAEGLRKGEDSGPVATWPWRKGESFSVSFPAAIDEEPLPAWIFWPSGTCEPAVVSYRGADGTWTAKYSALTARPELMKYATR